VAASGGIPSYFVNAYASTWQPEIGSGASSPFTTTFTFERSCLVGTWAAARIADQNGYGDEIYTPALYVPPATDNGCHAAPFTVSASSASATPDGAGNLLVSPTGDSVPHRSLYTTYFTWLDADASGTLAPYLPSSPGTMNPWSQLVPWFWAAHPFSVPCDVLGDSGRELVLLATDAGDQLSTALSSPVHIPSCAAATPTPTPAPSPTPSPAPTPAPSPTPSPAPTPTPPPSATPEPTPTPTDSPPSPSATPEPSVTAEPSASPTTEPTPEPSPSPTHTPEPSPSPTHTPEPSPIPAPDATLTAPATPTGSETLAYTVNLTEPITELRAADFGVAGTATGCRVGDPAGTRVLWTVELTGCSEGSVVLRLRAASVAGLAGSPGPPVDRPAASVTVDRTGPSADLACDAPETPLSTTSIACAVSFSEPPADPGSFTLADVLVGGSAGGWAAGQRSVLDDRTFAFTVSGSADGQVTIAVRAGAVTDAAANTTTASATRVATIDRTPPSVTAGPSAALGAGAALAGTAVPVAVSWAMSDGAGSGIVRVELSRSADGGATWGSPIVLAGTARSNAAAVPASGTARFRIRALDAAGNASAWRAGPQITARLVQQSWSAVRWAGVWTTRSAAAYSGGSERTARAAGAGASYTFTGRTVALVATRGPGRGKARVYVDGVLRGTVDLYRSSTQYRAVAWSFTCTSSRSHTVRVVVVGTAGRPQVDVDALIVMR